MAEKRHAMHGRDHAAGGADPTPISLPYAWILRTTDATVTTGSAFDTKTATGNTFDTGGDDGSVFTINLTDGRIQLNAEGIYQCYGQVLWTDQELSKYTVFGLNCGNTLETGSGSRDAWQNSYAANAFQSARTQQANFMAFVDGLAATAADNFFWVQSTNNNGSSRDIDRVFIQVVRLGSL